MADIGLIELILPPVPSFKAFRSIRKSKLLVNYKFGTLSDREDAYVEAAAKTLTRWLGKHKLRGVSLLSNPDSDMDKFLMFASVSRELLLVSESIFNDLKLLFAETEGTISSRKVQRANIVNWASSHERAY